MIESAAAAAWALREYAAVAGIQEAQVYSVVTDAAKNGLFRERREWAAARGLSRKPGGVQRPPWGLPELRAVLAVARDVAVMQARAAELRADEAVAEARSAQVALVRMLPEEPAGQ